MPSIDQDVPDRLPRTSVIDPHNHDPEHQTVAGPCCPSMAQPYGAPLPMLCHRRMAHRCRCSAIPRHARDPPHPDSWLRSRLWWVGAPLPMLSRPPPPELSTSTVQICDSRDWHCLVPPCQFRLHAVAVGVADRRMGPASLGALERSTAGNARTTTVMAIRSGGSCLCRRPARRLTSDPHGPATGSESPQLASTHRVCECNPSEV